ncbi:MAG: glycosyltransferase family 4 protein [Muribaculaceae bacterium]|nr:glycosyltransferase family 4 protein [Muribaculaceae bacterium]
MKIIHVLFNLRTGGTETMLIDIVNNQQAMGHDVTLLLINDGHEEHLLASVNPEVSVVRLNRREGSKNPLWWWRYNRALRIRRPDVVHIHNRKALALLSGPRSFKVVYTYHCIGDVNPYSSKADTLCAISQAVASDVKARGEGEPVVVYNGIEMSHLAVRRSDAPGRPVKILQIGSLNHHIKGQHVTLRALSLMKHGDVAVDFVGDGASRTMLEELTAGLGLQSRVRFRGKMSRKELYESIAGYDIALLPSLSEGFGLALVEPMSAGLPVVVSDLPGPMEVFAATGGGLSVPPDNAEALAEAIDAVIDGYDRFAAVAAAGREAVSRRFSIVNTVEHYIELYKPATGGNRLKSHNGVNRKDG